MKRYVYIRNKSGGTRGFYCIDYEFKEGKFYYLPQEGDCWYTRSLDEIESIKIIKEDDIENKLTFVKGVDY